ncbi:hypothetical protein F4823DRAFT_597175 [Ustulina deusta]|nr:hypothetical protein F4823DRAFT_597175 [Ustulina deusta]
MRCLRSMHRCISLLHSSKNAYRNAYRHTYIVPASIDAMLRCRNQYKHLGKANLTQSHRHHPPDSVLLPSHCFTQVYNVTRARMLRWCVLCLQFLNLAHFAALAALYGTLATVSLSHLLFTNFHGIFCRHSACALVQVGRTPCLGNVYIFVIDTHVDRRKIGS